MEQALKDNCSERQPSLDRQHLGAERPSNMRWNLIFMEGGSLPDTTVCGDIKPTYLEKQHFGTEWQVHAFQYLYIWIHCITADLQWKIITFWLVLRTVAELNSVFFFSRPFYYMYTVDSSRCFCWEIVIFWSQFCPKSESHFLNEHDEYNAVKIILFWF